MDSLCARALEEATLAHPNYWNGVFFWFLFCFVKTLFSFSFCQTKKYSEPTRELAKLRLDVLKTVAFEKTTSSNILFPLLSGQVIHPRLEALVEDIAVLPPGLAFFLTFFVASTAHRTSLAGLVSPFVPRLSFLTCFFAFTAHLTCLDRWGIRSSPFGAVRSRPCFFWHASSHLQFIYHFLTGGGSPYGLPPSPVASSPGLAFLTCLFAFTAHLTFLDRWEIPCIRPARGTLHAASCAGERLWSFFNASSFLLLALWTGPLVNPAWFRDFCRLSSSNSISFLPSFAPFALDRFGDSALGAGDTAARYTAPHWCVWIYFFFFFFGVYVLCLKTYGRSSRSLQPHCGRNCRSTRTSCSFFCSKRSKEN